MIRQLRDEQPASYDAGEQVIRISRELDDRDIERIVDAFVARLTGGLPGVDPELYRPMKQAEAAAWLGIDPATLSLWTTANRVPHVRLGERQPRYIRADLLSWLRATGQSQP